MASLPLFDSVQCESGRDAVSPRPGHGSRICLAGLSKADRGIKVEPAAQVRLYLALRQT